MLRIILMIAIVCAQSSAAHADALTFNCVFNKQWSPEGTGPTDFRFVISYDTLTNKAFMTGNAGVQELFAYRNSQAISFIEPLATGAAHVTTVALDGSAIHSRNSLIGGQFAPSQYSGQCTIAN